MASWNATIGLLFYVMLKIEIWCGLELVAADGVVCDPFEVESILVPMIRGIIVVVDYSVVLKFNTVY